MYIATEFASGLGGFKDFEAMITKPSEEFYTDSDPVFYNNVNKFTDPEPDVPVFCFKDPDIDKFVFKMSTSHFTQVP